MVFMYLFSPNIYHRCWKWLFFVSFILLELLKIWKSSVVNSTYYAVLTIEMCLNVKYLDLAENMLKLNDTYQLWHRIPNRWHTHVYLCFQFSCWNTEWRNTKKNKRYTHHIRERKMVFTKQTLLMADGNPISILILI